MCLPFLRWVHRFGRPDGVKYPLTMENKLRNFFIGHFELGLDIAQIIEHFKEWKTEEQLTKLAAAVKQEMEHLESGDLAAADENIVASGGWLPPRKEAEAFVQKVENIKKQPKYQKKLRHLK